VAVRNELMRLFALCACLVGLTAVGLARTSVEPVVPGADRSARAVWVLRSSLTTAESVRTMIQAVSRAGFDTVFLQVRGRGEAYYLSDIEPRTATLAAGFDPLALAIDLAHDAGLSVHAWVNVNFVASPVTLPSSAEHVVRRHPEWLMVPRGLAPQLANSDPASPSFLSALARWTRRESATVEGLYLSPVTGAAQAYSVSVIQELVERYPLDGLHLDYIRYPSETFDFSAGALAEFRASRLPLTSDEERARLDQAAARDPLAWTSYLPESWAAFRRERLTELVERIVSAASGARPDIVVSAAVVPDAAEARDRKGQDWAGWARDGLLDVVCPMVYTQDANVFARQVSGVRETVGDVPVWAGVGAYRLTATQAVKHIRLARQSGASGIALFSYDSLASARDGGARYFSLLRPALTEDEQLSPVR